MRIVIDLQGAQAASRYRGIGRYSLQFAQAMVRNGGNHECFIALNAAFSDTIEPIRAAFDGLVPQEQIVVWETPGPASGIDPANAACRHAAERVREAFLASLQPDWVLVTSLFESHSFSDECVTSINVHTSLPTAVVLYDLIPLIYRDIYLSNPVCEAWYLEKLDHLRRANLLLSISESSGREAVEHLGFDPADVVPIGTDCDARFGPISLPVEKRAHLRAAYGIERPFVMYTGGIDHRKNIEGLIRAYAALPQTLRHRHQLAVVCAVQPPERQRLRSLARKEGLGEDELILTGFVPDDDLLALYNACTLFVFPSCHEGFGLPALEAMRCGKAVLAANTSSLPEVVGRQDALFDPFDERAMAALIERALTDDAFRHDLEQHAIQQNRRFSWDETARRALAALEAAAPRATIAPPAPAPRRRRLAYVSPLPPEKTEIADYSAELIPELTRWYEVEVIVTQPEVADAAIRANCPIRTVEEFRARAANYDRVLYHFGNSACHEHMFVLLEEIPGVVVLHDFFLSDIQAHQDVHGWAPHAFARALLESHCYRAVRELFTVSDTAEVISRYPANLPVLQSALGVIVHSDYSRRLARQWYGDAAGTDWTVIPHLRKPASAADRKAARKTLGVAEDALLVCSFGFLAPTKLNHRLLEAWLASPLATDTKAHLVFVGENHGGDYGQNLLRRIRDSSAAGRIRITGWADVETFRQYLAAADIGVQLRTLSRGETSGTVLDCMNHGLATIVNAHGSFADLDPQGVWLLPDEFTDEELSEALTTLARDPERRRALGERPREIIRTRHAPRRCAEQYFEAIEGFYQRAQAGLPGLLEGFSHQPLPQEEWPRLAASLARNFPPAPRRRQLLVDISELVQRDAKSGIQRVVRAILRQWLDNPPEGFQVEPVYATADAPGYRYARRWTSRFLGIPEDWAEDSPAEAWAGDVFVGLDLQPHVVPAQAAFLHGWRNRGVKVWFVVYDLLPVLLPQVLFPEGAQAMHQNWLGTITQFDGVVAISRAVADELAEWLKAFGAKRERPLSLGWFHLGADVEQSVPTTGLPSDAQQVLQALANRPSFLMVGTVEPRKGHAQTLEAFEQLWADGADVNLVIVGKQGWMVEALVNKLRTHTERGKRLFWLEGISDEYLEKVYAASTCLIAASYGEGFGLPLIEAAQHKLPLIARDIPVFREVAGEHAFYFDNSRDPAVIAKAVRAWLALHRAGTAPSSQGLPWLTWRQSAERLLEIVLGQAKPYKVWPADGTEGQRPRVDVKI
jgi:glycosyltransferase involved in cell wall biosynthesis